MIRTLSSHTINSRNSQRARRNCWRTYPKESWCWTKRLWRWSSRIKSSMRYSGKIKSKGLRSFKNNLLPIVQITPSKNQKRMLKIYSRGSRFTLDHLNRRLTLKRESSFHSTQLKTPLKWIHKSINQPKTKKEESLKNLKYSSMRVEKKK